MFRDYRNDFPYGSNFKPRTSNPKLFFMPNLLTISLNNVRFRAYHGLYPEERQKGNDFVVNMQVSYVPTAGTIASLEDTIDYGVLFELMNTIMQQPVDLLETLVQGIAHAVHHKFSQVKQIVVSVEKLNPPIDKFSGSAAVSYKAEF
jgi:dihydroneopterin aldolase